MLPEPVLAPVVVPLVPPMDPDDPDDWPEGALLCPLPIVEGCDPAPDCCAYAIVAPPSSSAALAAASPIILNSIYIPPVRPPRTGS
jgi:hypothetical protein